MQVFATSIEAIRMTFGRTITVKDESGVSYEIDIYSEEGFRVLSELWTRSNWQHKLSYEPVWLGVPIIQLPEDILMMEELIYKVRPDVIIETGTAHGGSAIFYASILELIGKGRVISVDVEIRKYNRITINAHALIKRITLVEGSSVDDGTLQEVSRNISPNDTVLVALDSNHSYPHVSQELQKYSQFVKSGGYMVVFDGVMQILADAPNGKPEWRADSPARAVEDFRNKHPEFELDPYYNRLAVTYCPGGFLRRK